VFLNKVLINQDTINMRKSIFIAFIALFVGANVYLTQESNRNHPSTIKKEVATRGMNVLIDPRLRPYYIEVAQRLNLEGINPNRQQAISITVGTLPSGVLGIAMGMFVDNVVTVIISDAYWYKLSESQRRALLWHELAHDLFNVEHGSVEIMSTSMSKIDTNNIDQMVAELINYIKNGR
jgi:hypothetical protein